MYWNAHHVRHTHIVRRLTDADSIFILSLSLCTITYTIFFSFKMFRIIWIMNNNIEKRIIQDYKTYT